MSELYNIYGDMLRIECMAKSIAIATINNNSNDIMKMSNDDLYLAMSLLVKAISDVGDKIDRLDSKLNRN